MLGSDTRAVGQWVLFSDVATGLYALHISPGIHYMDGVEVIHRVLSSPVTEGKSGFLPDELFLGLGGKGIRPYSDILRYAYILPRRAL